MNLFKVDFYQGKTDSGEYGEIKHSLTDYEGDRVIHTLSISPTKLSSVSNYAREPRRVSFVTFVDDWIRDYILSGEYEHERHICHYEAKIYRDGTLIFTGIIDTSQLEYDQATEEIIFTIYDKLRLLSIYSDLTQYYSVTAGYEPHEILSYFVQKIETKIPIYLGMSNQFVMPSLIFSGANILELYSVTYSDMEALPSKPDWTYTRDSASYPGIYYGFYASSYTNSIVFAFAHKVVIKAEYGSLDFYYARYRGRIVRWFNGVCATIAEYDKETNMYETLAELDDSQAEFEEFFRDHSLSMSIVTGSLESTAVLNDHNYTVAHASGQFAKAFFSGNIFPTYLQPGESYESSKAEQTEIMSVLKAMLMVYNATIYTNASGTIVLASKGTIGSTTTSIDQGDVISLKTKRLNQERPETSTIQILAGDTALLERILKDYLIEFHDSKWAVNMVILGADDYSLAIQEKISVGPQDYLVTEVGTDYAEDEINVTGWLI